MNQACIDTVRLLLLVAPRVFASGRLGLKGGTALNLFLHDMPRLSVDIDAVFLDHTAPRDEAMVAIGNDLALTKSELESLGLSVSMPAGQGGEEVKLVVADATAQVKIEVNHVFRGTLQPIAPRGLVAAAEDLFTTSLTLPVLAPAELYAGKLVAAFDRQHPRDWFDVLHMRQRQGLNTETLDCFVAYLAGHNRPVHEVLFPNLQPMRGTFESEFAGMTREPASLQTLEAVRAETLAELPRLLTDRQREFLLSLVRAEPRWELLPFAHAADLPALSWKLQNLARLRATNRRKFAAQHAELAEKLARS